MTDGTTSIIEGVECPLCKNKELRQYNTLGGAEVTCKRCRLSVSVEYSMLSALTKLFVSASNSNAQPVAGDTMKVMTIQRKEAEEPSEVSSGCPASNQAIITTSGPVLEALIDLDKVAELVPDKSPLGSLEDSLPLHFCQLNNRD